MKSDYDEGNINSSIEFYLDSEGTTFKSAGSLLISDVIIDSNWRKYEWNNIESTIGSTEGGGTGGIGLEINNATNRKLFISNPIFVRGNDTNQISINQLSSQPWFGNYYYPVLPIINKFGEFDEDNFGLQRDQNAGEKIPFGDRERWDDEDNKAPITNTSYVHGNMEIDMDFSNINNDEYMADVSGINNLGIVIGDYKVKYSDKKVPEKADDIIIPRVKKDKKGKSH